MKIEIRLDGTGCTYNHISIPGSWIIFTYRSDMTLTGLCQLELTKNLGPLCIAIGMLIIICSLGTADRISKCLATMTCRIIREHSGL